MKLALLIGLIPAALLAQNPWNTPQGRGCFERWISEASWRLNSVNGDRDFNSRKPWSFNQYGLVIGRGMHSNYEPDAFPRYNNNKYWFMWDSLVYTNGWNWRPWQAAQIPPLRSYVTNCAGSGSCGGGWVNSGFPAGGGGNGGRVP